MGGTQWLAEIRGKVRGRCHKFETQLEDMLPWVDGKERNVVDCKEVPYHCFD